MVRGTKRWIDRLKICNKYSDNYNIDKKYLLGTTKKGTHSIAALKSLSMLI